MKLAEFPEDLPYEDILRMVAAHEPCPEIEETKELVRRDLANKVLMGEITEENRQKLLGILGMPSRFFIPSSGTPYPYDI